MGLEAKLQQKMSQTLTMTPQLQQAIKLLQLGRLEYKEAIEKELLENPILEEVRDEDGQQEARNEQGEFNETTAQVTFDSDSNGENDSSDEQKIDWEGYLESFTDYHGASNAKGTVDFDDRPSFENSIIRTETLSEYLLNQLRFLDLQETDLRIAGHVIGNLDRDGYLTVSHEDLSVELDVPTGEIERVLEEIHALEPRGIAARNLSECLLLQLEDLGLGSALEAQIVKDHLERLEKRKYDQIAKDLHVPVDEVYHAVTIIQSLEPRPGRQFADEDIRYVVPDVYVQKVGNEYVVTLNEDGLPKLRVSPYYLKVLQEQDAAVAKTYLHERLKAASWLIKSIHQRQQTIYRVTESIVKFQREFLDHGIDRLKPLVLKDIANDIGMHESTVSRVTTNKYVHTPQGVFELKYFFTTGIKSSQGDVSSSSVKEKIKALIVAEDPKHPVSDQEIVDRLKKENIDIARRTVAKYRENLGIDSSAKRKKLF